MSAISRNAVYWVGSPPTVEEQLEFERRNLVIRMLEDDIIIDFNVARAIVYSASPPYLPVVMAEIGRLRNALDHGLMVYLLAADDAIQAHLLRVVPDAVRRAHLAMLVRSRTGSVPSFECAENIARHDAGRHANTNLQIQLPPNVHLDADQEFIVRRAFSDCTAVSLEPLSGGRSATTFFAQATLTASEVGPRPLPFFVKLDEAHKILIEVTNYQLYAMGQCNHLRCCGSNCSICPNSIFATHQCTATCTLKTYVFATTTQLLSTWRMRAVGLFVRTWQAWRSGLPSRYQAPRNRFLTARFGCKLQKNYSLQLR